MDSSINYFSLLGSIVIQMLIILNPPSAAAVMLGVTGNLSVKERLAISQKVCIIGSALLFIFALFGQVILNSIFHISTEAFQVGGGMYLFTIGLAMTFAEPDEESVSDVDKDKIYSMIITPLATPLLVGPGTITAVLVTRMGLPEGLGYQLTFYSAVAIALALVYLVFYLACKFSKYLTPLFLKILEKLVGILLMCIAISSVIHGITTFISKLKL